MGGHLRRRSFESNAMYFMIYFSDNKLFEFSESYRTKNVSLTVEVERLKRENLDLQVKVETG